MYYSQRTVPKWVLLRFAPVLAFIFLVGSPVYAAENLELQPLIDEALKKSPEVIAAEARADAARFRIPQAKSLPDPMFMVGYQNEGFNRYTYGDTLMSSWMFSASQMFPFPGKLGLKEEIAAKDAENSGDLHMSTRLRIAARVKELYYDLLLAYKDLDLIGEKMALLSQIEDAALARYSAGEGSQQEVLMAQAEKYMLVEKEEMFRQKIQSTEAMLNTTIGRDVNAPLGRPVETAYRPYGESLVGLLEAAYERSPDIKAKEKMVTASGMKVRLAQKEYYPDFTISAEYDKKGGPFMDMWALRTAVNIPLYYKTRQRQAVYEARALQVEAKNDLEATKLMIASGIRDNYSMVKSAEKLLDLYKNGLIPKTYQDFESALAGYATGKVEAITVISRLKALLEYETLYWGQFFGREKAIARIGAVTGSAGQGGRMR
jgi:cobalt-zinc-cadmium efflux system outer membrane protein